MSERFKDVEVISEPGRRIVCVRGAITALMPVQVFGCGPDSLAMRTSDDLRGGVSRVVVTPNQSMILPAFGETSDEPFAITNTDRLLAVAKKISTSSLIPAAILAGVALESIGLENQPVGFNTAKLRKFFAGPAKKLTNGLMIYGQGANVDSNLQIPAKYVHLIVEEFKSVGNEHVVALEGFTDDQSLDHILSRWPEEVPVHITDVFSQPQLDAKIRAAESGVDVTCAVTPERGDFFWENLKHIEIAAISASPREILSGMIRKMMGKRIKREKLYKMLVTEPERVFGLPHIHASTDFLFKEDGKYIPNLVFHGDGKNSALFMHGVLGPDAKPNAKNLTLPQL